MLSAGHPASAGLTGITSMAARHVLLELAKGYERSTQTPVQIEYAGGVDVARRVMDGEAFDFVVLASRALDTLAEAHRVDADTRVDLAHSSVAVAVAAGAESPDLRSEQAVRDAVLAARSIGYSTGPSGMHLRRLFERWGIARDASAKAVEAPPGVPVGELVARGDVEIGFQQLSELRGMPGIAVAGVLPREIQEVTVFAGALCVAARHRDAASDFLAFCASPQADEVKRRYGLDPP